MEELNPSIDKLKESTYLEIFASSIFMIEDILITTKHPDYSEEEEMRLINAFSPKNEDIFFRVSNGKLIPTMKVKGIKSCIQKIIVGPLGDPQLNSLALETYKGWYESAFDIETSKTPYR